MATMTKTTAAILNNKSNNNCDDNDDNDNGGDSDDINDDDFKSAFLVARFGSILRKKNYPENFFPSKVSCLLSRLKNDLFRSKRLKRKHKR